MLSNHHFLIRHSFLQPSFIVAIFAPEENTEEHLSTGDAKLQKNETSLLPTVSKKSSLVDALMYYIQRADDLIKRFFIFFFCLISFPSAYALCSAMVMLIEI